MTLCINDSGFKKQTNEQTKTEMKRKEGRTKSKIRKGTGEETKTRDRRRRKATWAARRAGGGRGAGARRQRKPRLVRTRRPGTQVSGQMRARCLRRRAWEAREPVPETRGSRGSESRLRLHSVPSTAPARRPHFSSSSLKGNQLT